MNVPTMALAMPPPASPTGLGNWVKNAQLMELKPCLDQMIKHEHQRRDDQDRAHERERLHQGVLELAPAVIGGGHRKGDDELKMVENPARRAAVLILHLPSSFVSVLRFHARPGEGFQQQLRQRVDEHGHAQQHQADFKQRAQIGVGRGFGEFVGDDAGQRVAGREKRLGDLRACCR